MKSLSSSNFMVDLNSIRNSILVPSVEGMQVNFDLLFYKQGEDILLRVIDSPGGQAQGKLSESLQAIELIDLLVQLRQHPGHVTVDQIKKLGRTLFNALFTDQDIYGCFQRSLHLEGSESLRLMLRLNDVPDLSNLPWEYIYDEDLDAFLVLSSKTPLVRYIEVPSVAPSVDAEIPLRILIVVSSPSDLPPLDVEAEYKKVEDSLEELKSQNLVEVTHLPVATLSQLRNALRENAYHIIHFIGHGKYDSRTQAGGLLFEDAEGNSDHVSAEALGTHLNDHRSLQLAILNACEGGRASNTHIFAGVGQKLVQQGVPACIAMQFPVTDRSATLFAHEFYRALVDGYTIEAATTEARKAIDGERENVEWGTPVVFTRLPSTQLVNVASERTSAVSNDERHTSKTSIQIGGNNSGDINVSDGDINIDKRVDKRTYNIGSIGGDFVGGDQIISGDKTHGEKFTGDSSVAYLNGIIERVLNMAQVESLDAVDKEDLQEALQDFKEEAEKEEPSDKRLDRILKRIELIVPFAVEVIVNALLNPGAVVADGVRAGVRSYKQSRS